jgi:hypothetical protein
MRVSLQTRIKSEKGSLVSDWTHLEFVTQKIKKESFSFFLERRYRE